MVEYLIIIATVAIAALGAWHAFGSSVGSTTDEQSVRIASMTAGAGASSGDAPGAVTASLASPPESGAAPSGSPPAESLPPDEGGGERGWIESVLGFGASTVTGFAGGAVDTVSGLVSLGGTVVGGAGWVVTHPGEAIGGVWHAVTNPGETAGAAWDFATGAAGGIANAIGGAWDTAWNGTPEERGDLLGRGIFEVALTVVTGGAGQATKARWATKVDDLARAAGAVTDLVGSGRRLVVGGGRADDFPRLRDDDVAFNIDPGARPDFVGDINDPPFLPNSFGEVLYENVEWDAFAGSGSRALAKTHEMLEPGGRVTVTTGQTAPVDEVLAQLRQAGFTDVRAERVPDEWLEDYLSRTGMSEERARDIVERSAGDRGWMFTGVKAGE